MDVLRLQETLQSLLAQFASVAAHLHTAEGAAVAVGEGIVDPDGPGLHLLEETFGEAGVVGTANSPQAVFSVIGPDWQVVPAAGPALLRARPWVERN